jgi:hypothetical protein
MPQFVVTHVVPAVGGHTPVQKAMPTPGELPAPQLQPAESETPGPHSPEVGKVVPPSRVVKEHPPRPLLTRQ